MRGWVTVTPTTDEPEERFAPGSVLLVESEPRTVLESRVGYPMALLLDGVHDRNDAESLRGLWLYVDSSGESADGEDEFYDHQLEGLMVSIDGRPAGVVREVLHLPGQDVLAVTALDGREVLVPFVSQIVPRVDIAQARIDVVPVEGLFDDED